MSKEKYLTPEACNLIDWLIGKNKNQEQIGQKNTEHKHNILWKIEEEHFPELYGAFKSICKHYGYSHPSQSEIALFAFKNLIPRLYELGIIAGMEPREYAKEQLLNIAKDLDTLLENNETVIKLQETKKSFYADQNDMITFTPASKMQ